ncbi:hypothetical protein [Acetobacter sicerae]|uniref:hypothetical protein n=1 Tax=Acetobacter sicerae TaxID=85325 RepID=UPI00156ABFC2|nr:hypothetical protein [Acetobacter sicerae]NHN93845.1 hypothetical protein [Acetobacter sicerae]
MTRHLDQRMNQRGITRDLIDLTLSHGTWEGDRCILKKKDIQAFLNEMDQFRSRMVRMMDKGGLVVVEAENRQITTYPLTSRTQRQR